MGMAKKRMHYIDVANVLAIIAVLYLHCNGIVHRFTPTSAWAQSLVVEVICYWAVPIFFMNSGITLLRYRTRYSTRDFFKKRFSGAVLPFLFWSIVFLLYYRSTGQLKFKGLTEAINLSLSTKVEPTVWFFLPLFGLYLWMPVLSALSERRDVLDYLAGVSVLCIAVLPMILKPAGITFSPAGWMGIANGTIVFPLVGIALHDRTFKRGQRMGIYALGALACIVRYGLAYRASMAAGRHVFRFTGYTSALSLMLGVAVFVFIRSVDWEKAIGAHFVDRILPRLSSWTLGVYILHMFVYRQLVHRFSIDQVGLLWRLLGPIAIYLICIALTAMIKKIPILRRIMP